MLRVLEKINVCIRNYSFVRRSFGVSPDFLTFGFVDGVVDEGSTSVDVLFLRDTAELLLDEESCS